MPAILDHQVEAEYLALVRAFPLIAIRDDAHLAAAFDVIDRLIENPNRSAAEEEYLGALTELVETYENTQCVSNASCPLPTAGFPPGPVCGTHLALRPLPTAVGRG